MIFVTFLNTKMQYTVNLKKKSLYEYPNFILYIIMNLL